MKKTLHELVKNVQGIKSLGCPAEQKALIALVLGIAKQGMGDEFPEVDDDAPAQEPDAIADAADETAADAPKKKGAKKSKA